jgi:uncharacterized protein (DUF2461 family)
MNKKSDVHISRKAGCIKMCFPYARHLSAVLRNMRSRIIDRAAHCKTAARSRSLDISSDGAHSIWVSASDCLRISRLCTNRPIV